MLIFIVHRLLAILSGIYGTNLYHLKEYHFHLEKPQKLHFSIETFNEYPTFPSIEISKGIYNRLAQITYQNSNLSVISLPCLL